MNRADLAVKRSCGSMIWHHDLPTDALPIRWMRAENAHGSEIYIRPSRRYRWPLVFLDDLPVRQAFVTSRKYDALVVETSTVGGCHVWLTCSRALDEGERYRAQSWLAQRTGSDLGSVSGEHLGRLAGFKNFKRGGVWVNVLDRSCRGRSWRPVLTGISKKRNEANPDSVRAPRTQTPTGRDNSQSGIEWGWVCGMLEAGFDQKTVLGKLAERAASRRGKDLDRYVRTTLAKAIERTNTSLTGGF